MYITLSQGRDSTTVPQYINYDLWLFRQVGDGNGPRDYPASFQVHLCTPVRPRAEPTPTTDPEPKSMPITDQEPTPVTEPEAAGMSNLELNLIALDSQECDPAHVPIPKAFWTLCFQALSWTFLLWWFRPASKLLYLCRFGLAPWLLCLRRVPPSFLAPFLHCFCSAPRRLLCWLHLAHLLHLKLPGSQRSALAPPPASEPMTLLTLSTHRLIAPSALLWSVIPQAPLFLWLHLGPLSL